MLSTGDAQNSMLRTVVASWIMGIAAGILTQFTNYYSPCRPNSTIARIRRKLTQITILSVVIVLLNVPSLVIVAQFEGHPLGGTDITTLGKKYSWSYGWGRPVVAVVTAFILGTSASTSPAVRGLYVFYLASEVLLSSIAAMELNTRCECIAHGSCIDGVNGYYRVGLLWMYRRELLSSAVCMWCFFDVATIGFVLGFRRNRYTQRQISTTHNDEERLAAELVKYGGKVPSWKV